MRTGFSPYEEEPDHNVSGDIVPLYADNPEHWTYEDEDE
jgi:hypothetical protein